ncbi:hypothetical protein [Corynebacterium doosanense]|uniref:Pyridine nucleotide-disulfide oxidoreductase n=1 Tax=Corynebacterium doosanense CAU 212 = DSM 45436 TaxID=558173 RepID=A0A097IJL2_9CORY|nr:hypothetical protein [Corynebacterium doosanense]AIT62347.1 hypothetical protein CDOO_12345 [Corynebacterium doosanense CAU 212 = DSM 45436]
METATDTVRIAVIGAGPAGLRAAEAQALATDQDTFVDLYERRPAPFGLLAYCTCPRLRLLGNIEVGRDIAVDDLHDYYDTVIDATGPAARAVPARRVHTDGAAVIELLRSRHIPFTTWETPERSRGEARWEDIVTRARAVPVCDQ